MMKNGLHYSLPDRPAPTKSGQAGIPPCPTQWNQEGRRASLPKDHGWNSLGTTIFLLLAFFMNAALCEDRSCMLVAPSAIRLTGNPHVDFAGLAGATGGPSQLETNPVSGGSHRSPWLAAGLSLVVPGSGQIYTESYWEAAASIVIEAAALIVASKYDKKGNKQTAFFEGYADNYWSVNRYAEWTLANATAINQNVNPADYQVIVNGAVNWYELNRLERDIGNWYTHTLPAYGEQQYYELIGKYPQFNQGWEGATDEMGQILVRDRGDGPRTSRDLYYEVERARADDFYGTASTFVNVAIINHVLSAIDAAWSASRFNKFNVRVGLQNVPTILGYASVPVVKLSYSF